MWSLRASAPQFAAKHALTSAISVAQITVSIREAKASGRMLCNFPRGSPAEKAPAALWFFTIHPNFWNVDSDHLQELRTRTYLLNTISIRLINMTAKPMQYRTIVLNLNDELRVPKLVKSAASLVTSPNAHVVGLYVMPSVLPPPKFVGDTSSAWIEEQTRFFEDQANRIKSVFEDLVQGASFTHEWCFDGSSFDKSIADSVIEHGYASDLIIVAQGSKNGWLNDVPERAVIESGRPVLVVPSEGGFQEFGSNVMIAWKKSKEATRAVFDALPALQKARNVRLVTLAEDDADEDRADQTCADITALLQRHGIDAEIEGAGKGDLSIGDSLIEYAQMRHHDMLVMGLYGHSRFREFFLGGASRDVLQHMPLPVLMSH